MPALPVLTHEEVDNFVGMNMARIELNHSAYSVYRAMVAACREERLNGVPLDPAAKVSEEVLRLFNLLAARVCSQKD